MWSCFSTALARERESLFNCVGPIYVFRLGFYARKSDARRIDSLKKARQVGGIATCKDDFREQIVKSLGFTDLDSSSSPQGNIRKLVS